jgi:hypothetical protein
MDEGEEPLLPAGRGRKLSSQRPGSLVPVANSSRPSGRAWIITEDTFPPQGVASPNTPSLAEPAHSLHGAPGFGQGPG